MISQPHILDNDQIGFPILETDILCYFIWKDDQTFDEALLLNGTGYPGRYDDITVWNESHDEEIECCVYEITCTRSNKEYFLICNGYLEEIDQLKSCVCVLRNTWNLKKFYIDYVLPFSGKNYV
ncbi:MAG: hypothetical protein ACM3JI_01770 [Anaerolineae bacterium]